MVIVVVLNILYEQFNNRICGAWGFTVQIIEKLPGNGREDFDLNLPNKKPKLLPEITSKREQIEDLWMCSLQTVYPYGLNDRCKGRDWRIRADTDLVARTLFTKLGHCVPSKTRSVKHARP